MTSDTLHSPNTQAEKRREIRRQLRYLLTLFFADEKMAQLAKRNSAFSHLSEEVSGSALPLQLQTVAMAVRGVLDGNGNNSRLGDGDICGRYFPNAAKSAEESLSLRKACNFAIHAKSAQFFQQESDYSDLLVLGGQVILRGYHQNRRPYSWKAEIDMEKFALACLAAINNAQE